MRRRGGGGDDEPSTPRRPQRPRVGNCRVCHGRVEPADRLTCAECGTCVHRRCAPPAAEAADSGGDVWVCACCRLGSDEDASSSSSSSASSGPSVEDNDDEVTGEGAQPGDGDAAPWLMVGMGAATAASVAATAAAKATAAAVDVLTVATAVEAAAASAMSSAAMTSAALGAAIQILSRVAAMATAGAVPTAPAGVDATATAGPVAMATAGADATTTAGAAVKATVGADTTATAGPVATATATAELIAPGSKRSHVSSSDDGPESEKRLRPSSPQPTPAAPTADDAADVLCPICSQPIGVGATRPETCNHAFCFGCLTRWRSVSDSCPIDRIGFNAVLVSLWPGQPPVRLPMPPVALCHQGRQQQLNEADSAIEFGVCAICGQANRPGLEFEDLLVCDHCEIAYHMECLGTEMRRLLDETLAEGQPWYCEDCERHLQHQH